MTVRRLSAGAAAVYGGLLGAEVLLWRREPRSVLKLMERGLYVVDEEGPKLRPGARLRFDDGFARGVVEISSLGHRGSEPRAEAGDRVLLVGDSFAFGSLLDQSETIAVCMERLDPTREVVNLGVTGYNLPEQLAPLERWTLAARDVVFLFCGNDLEGTVDQLIVDGYRMRRLQHPDGTPFSDEAMRAATARRIADIRRSRRLSGAALGLRRVRSGIRRWATRGRPRPLDPFTDDAARAEAVARGVAATEEMRELAERRGMALHVVVVPTLDEVRAGTHGPAVEAFVARLDALGHAPVRLLGRLGVEHYWAHDGHFNPLGARAVAQILHSDLELS